MKCTTLSRAATVSRYRIRKVYEIEMNNFYKEAFENIAKSFKKLSDMIIWLAERTLSAKDYKEFAHQFSEKKPDDTKAILKELLKNKENT